MTEFGVLAPTLFAVGLLMAVSAAVLASSRVPHAAAPAFAILRGAAQLAAVSLILGAVIVSAGWVAVALAVMFGVATMTATRRLGWDWRHLAMVAGSMAAGIAVSLVIVFATGAIDFTPRYGLALGGIVIGNSMAIAALAGRRFNEAVIERWDEVEGWLALGASARQATRGMARGAVYAALIPSTDQTKTTGLVTLPGAFVGAIFGGLSPLEAGRFQIVVLASIMAAGSVTAVLLISMLAPVRVRPRRLF
ncbi:ABC transporter permease [Arthrobacter sp. ISL-5]|uniref:ABC transporter permease n=1 Tax=Arthrobacter sp. ISL-5 TaxID=2819111 RepID=UPI001BE934AB|nr:ABC transporter permease [Arthrobacter sp. ISL-5]MBT2554692.1 ABC transporter permease [Arthrobacter sp. ISL-5]